MFRFEQRKGLLLETQDFPYGNRHLLKTEAAAMEAAVRMGEALCAVASVVCIRRIRGHSGTVRFLKMDEAQRFCGGWETVEMPSISVRIDVSRGGPTVEKAPTGNPGGAEDS